MAKIDNITLNDEDFGKKSQQQAKKLKRVVHESNKYFIDTPQDAVKVLEGSKCIKVSRSTPNALKALEKVFAKRPISSEIKDLKCTKKSPPKVISEGDASRLSKRGRMDYINRHTAHHINPSELPNISKEELLQMCTTLVHIR